MNILNAQAIHANGQPSMMVGIRGNAYKLYKDSTVVKLVDPSTSNLMSLQATFLDSSGNSLETQISTLKGYFQNGVLKVANGGTANSQVDTTPTQNSTKMVTSGGVWTAISQIVPQTVDDELSTSSTNPVQNKVVTAAINGLDERIQVFEDLIENGDILTEYDGQGTYVQGDTSGSILSLG